MITTSVLKAMLDQPSVCLVLHMNALTGMLNYAQNSRCAECNDLPARSLIILTDD